MRQGRQGDEGIGELAQRHRASAQGFALTAFALAEARGQIPSSRLLVQWHITDRCPRRCRHCYIPDHNYEPGLDRLLAILDRWIALDRQARALVGDAWRLDFNLTGGELLSHPDWREFLEQLRTSLPRSRFALLLSGELLTDSVADELASRPLRYIQFSLDGGRKDHEEIRGPGSFETVLSAIRRMSRRGVDVVVSHTAFPGRKGALADAAKAARDAGARSIWTDRVVPGPGQPGWDPASTQAYLDELAECSKRMNRADFRVRTSRALQFLSCGGEPYTCAAGDGLLSVLADGTMVPCRRLPIPLAILPDDDPFEAWRSHPVVTGLRTRAPDGCELCLFRDSCRGGAPCLTFAQTGNALLTDAACPAPSWVRHG